MGRKELADKITKALDLPAHHDKRVETAFDALERAGKVSISLGSNSISLLPEGLQERLDQRQSLVRDEKELGEPVSSSSLRPIDVTLRQNNDHLITRRATRGGFCVEMDLPRSGKLRLQEDTAAETMVATMERLLAEFGMDVLTKLHDLRTGRGPLLSRRPSVDFLNPNTGELYTNHKIPGTDFYVLTHSDTQEKVEALQRALRLIGLQPTKFRVFREQS
jgi:hypothetical protein